MHIKGAFVLGENDFRNETGFFEKMGPANNS